LLFYSYNIDDDLPIWLQKQQQQTTLKYHSTKGKYFRGREKQNKPNLDCCFYGLNFTFISNSDALANQFCVLCDHQTEANDDRRKHLLAQESEIGMKERKSINLNA